MMERNIDRKTTLCVCLALLLVLGRRPEGIAQDDRAAGSSGPKHAEVTIPNTQLRTLRSQIVDQVFNIYVQLPPGYATDSAALFPVLYITDANRAFPMVANISTVLESPRTNFPEIIVVGIGYPGNDMSDWAARRTRDLTPTNDRWTDDYWNGLLAKMSRRDLSVRSGGASRFLDFIVNELIPFVEANYRVSHSDRGLAGYSYGGLFALYAFFARPGAFGRYFAGSPSVDFNNGVIFNYENEFAARAKELKGRIFLSAGGLEDSSTIAGVTRMAETLRSGYSPGLQVSMQVFEGEDHRSCMAPAVMRAFRILYGQ